MKNAIPFAIHLLAGPVIWITHFMVVYLLVEMACGFDLLVSEPLGIPTVSVIVTAVTLVAMVGAGWFVVRSATMRVSGGVVEEFVGFGGILLGALFTVAIAFVGLPALVISPC
jgi:hypothetical protein